MGRRTIPFFFPSSKAENVKNSSGPVSSFLFLVFFRLRKREGNENSLFMELPRALVARLEAREAARREAAASLRQQR